MLKVQEYLKSIDGTCEIALEKLKEEYGVKSTIWKDKLVVLNYDQIDSAKLKFHPIVRECRSLVLELGSWEVVSRAFDRFYNYSEDPDCEYKVEDLVAHEKVDGSLVSFFNYEGEWLYRTKSVIMPDGIINGNALGVTWKDAIEQAIDVDKLSSWSDSWTYICELVCDFNRVVVRYPFNKPKLFILNTRSNIHGEYCNDPDSGKELFAELHGLLVPKEYKFDTLDHCLQSAKELRNLEEGYVMYTKNGEPVMKVKNPAYVAAHHLKGEGVLTEKRILDLILMNEVDEYLSIFPEDSPHLLPYIKAKDTLDTKLSELCIYVSDTMHLEQKEFAIEIKDNPCAALGFKLRQGKTLEEIWNNLTTQAKYRLILAYK